ncbi:MAG: DHA2 family efflux MFS transporter permease subunit [Oligoflexia bacterium]|nr:DHA2 family efflux MFS transporter permease subunit [Oligoflexia bacterium]
MNGKVVAILITAAVASLLEIIDSSIVNVAIPTMMGNIGATLDEISWVTTGYMIANSIVLPIAAWLGTRLGRRRYFTTAILLFTISSFACGMAPNLPILVLCRIIQGLAGGALLPTSQTLIQEQFPAEKAGMAMAIFGLSVMVGPALGPTLGGYLTDNFGWRSIFNVNVPIGLLAAVMSWLNVEDAKGSEKLAEQARKSGVDWFGLLFLCVGVGCFQYILERGEADGWWDSKAIRACAVFAFLGISSFIYWELSIPNPIMNLRLFKSNVVRSGTALMLMLGIMLYALTFVVPIFVSNVIPVMNATQTGILFMPGAIATAIFMLPVGNLLRIVNPKVLVLIGLLLGEASVYTMSQFTTDSSANSIYLPLILRGIAMAFLFVPINQMVLGAFRGPELGQVAGMQNFFRQIGGSIGISSLDTLLTRFGAQHYNDLMASVSALNPAGYQSYVRNMAMPAAKMSSTIGLWDPQTLSIKALYGRVMQQVFIMSFDQLCWVIMVIIAMGLIPLYFIKVTKFSGPIMDVH